MSSRDRVDVMRPGGHLVVEGAGLEAAMQDANQPVSEECPLFQHNKETK